MALDTFQPYLFVSAGEQSNKYLTPVISPGGIASFQAQRAQSITGLKVRIDPIQEGSGDPSPTNIRPISGRTGLTVTAAGRNLLMRAGESITMAGVTWTVNADGSITAFGTSTARSYIRIIKNEVTPVRLPAGIYTYSLTPTGSDYSNVRSLLGSYMGNTYYRNVVNVNSANNYKSAFTWSDADENASFDLSIEISKANKTVNCTLYPQIEVGSTQTAYEPYKGQTYTVKLETETGTVYGGTLDVVSGVLTVDWDYIASYDGETLPEEWISDRDVYAAGTTPTTGAQVVYKLATPQTYQLTPAEVRTIAGFNQIYSDAGPVIDIKF